VVSKDGQVHLAGRYVIAAEILGGRRVGIRIEQRLTRRPLTMDRRLSGRTDKTSHPGPRNSGGMGRC
jgi:hypothetical protein